MSLPSPLVTCPMDKVGDDTDMRWVILVALIHRRRDNRVAAAHRVLRSRSPQITKDQRVLMRGVIDGSGDLILQKLRAAGYGDDDA